MESWAIFDGTGEVAVFDLGENLVFASIRELDDVVFVEPLKEGGDFFNIVHGLILSFFRHDVLLDDNFPMAIPSAINSFYRFLVYERLENAFDCS